VATRLLSNIEPVLEIESPIKEKESQLSINAVQSPDPKKEAKEENKPTPNRLLNRPGYKDHLIDDLLGFGRPKRQ
jgi:hypothetical protein